MSQPGFLQSLDLVLFVWSDSQGLTKKYRSPQHLPEQVFIRVLGESLMPRGISFWGSWVCVAGAASTQPVVCT